jgi:hypothetical protein
MSEERDRIDAFHERGFYVVPGFLDVAERARLRRACDVALHHVRKSSQETGHTTPSISLLADPNRYEDDPRGTELVATLVGSGRVCALFRGLTHPGEEDTPRLKHVQYYHEQTKRDWDGDWHRDSQFSNSDPEAERVIVETITSVHFRVALEDDDRLEIVRGSHARWDTPDELCVRKGRERSSTSMMPEAFRIVLRAGDACVFHAWSIHRATYRRAPVRRTVDALYAFGRPPKKRWPSLL